MLASVIVLGYNHWDLTHARMMELYKYMEPECEVVLVDNGSPDEDVKKGMEWWKGVVKHFTLTNVFLDKNYGFGLGNNIGVEAASGKYVILLSNDVIIKYPFIPRTVQTIDAHGRILLGGRIINWAGGWNQIKSTSGIEYVVPYCEGYALATTKDLWENVLDGFDSRYGLADCEDVDLSVQAHCQNVQLGLLPPVFTHLGGMTAKTVLPDRLALTKENKIKLDAKWASQLDEAYRFSKDRLWGMTIHGKN